jgi:hypothetical protein
MDVNFSFLIDLSIAILLVILFFKETDILKKQLALFLFNFIVLVVFSEYIFGIPYSSKSDNFSASVDNVKLVLYLFSFVFFICTRHVTGKQLNLQRAITTVTGTDFIVVLPILFFLIYYASTKGIRITGDFVNHTDDRSQLTDYVYVYAMICLVSLRGSIVILIAILLLAMAHLLAAERMRAFVYIISLLFIYYGIGHKKHQASALLLTGFVFATVVGLLRMGTQQMDSNFNVTHFGSVTISSLYLLDIATYFDFVDKVRFALGALLANIIPSSLVPLDYNIRNYLVSQHDIPGGGWLPIWVFSISGYLGVIVSAIILGIFYRFLANAKLTADLRPHILAKYTMMVIFIATLPRWFMYTPFQVVKMPLYGYLGTFILVLCINGLTKRQYRG